MPIALGVLAALFIGVSDTFGRASARRANSVSHVSTQMLVGAFVVLPLTWLIDSSFLWLDVLSGALSGIFVGVGLAIVYRAMAESSSALAAPIAGVMAAVLPLVWDLADGATIEGLALVGCAIAVVSMVLVSWNPDLEGKILNGVGWALLGGIFFGASIVFAGATSVESGVWPAFSQRLVAFAAMIPIASVQSAPVFLPKAVRKFGFFGGIAGALGMCCLVVGAQRGDLGTVSVIASTYPAVIVVLATLFDDDEIRWWQGVGVAAAILGTALIALG